MPAGLPAPRQGVPPRVQAAEARRLRRGREFGQRSGSCATSTAEGSTTPSSRQAATACTRVPRAHVHVGQEEPLVFFLEGMRCRVDLDFDEELERPRVPDK